MREQCGEAQVLREGSLGVRLRRGRGVEKRGEEGKRGEKRGKGGKEGRRGRREEQEGEGRR